MSAETRRALGELADRLRESPPDTAIQETQDRLIEIQGRINGVVESLPEQAQERARGLLQTALDAERIAKLLAGEFLINVHDGGRSDHIQGTFGQLIGPDELHSLASQSDTTSAYISTKSSDSAVLTHLDGYGKFLNDWWLVAVMPVAELLSRATTSTTQISIGVRETPVVREAITESERLRQQRLSSDLEETLNSAKTATTNVGESELTKAFSDVQSEAEWAVRRWTLSVFVFVLIGVLTPFIAINVDIEALKQLTELSGLLIKVSSSLPFFGLAAYSGHIAAQHRETSRHLTILNAQIKSVRAYSNELPDSNRLELMTALGHRAFADPGFVSKDKGNVTLVPDGATDFLKQLRGLIADTKKPE
ncbi:hypothetical protein [Mycolicibacterium psychrotolerans]|nr:hypothetical protein [Mycolicibacterium psychrotolerans]